MRRPDGALILFASNKEPASSGEPAGVCCLNFDRILVTHEKDIPSPATQLCVVRILDFSAVFELISVLVSLLRFFVIQVQSLQSKLLLLFWRLLVLRHSDFQTDEILAGQD